MRTHNFKDALEVLQRYMDGMNTHNFKAALEFLQRYRVKMKAEEPTSALESIHRYIIAGTVVVLVLTCGVGVWATTTRNIRCVDFARHRRR